MITKEDVENNKVSGYDCGFIAKPEDMIGSMEPFEPCWHVQYLADGESFMGTMEEVLEWLNEHAVAEKEGAKLPPYTEKAVKSLILELHRFQNTAWEGVENTTTPFDNVWIKADTLLTHSLKLLGFDSIEEVSA